MLLTLKVKNMSLLGFYKEQNALEIGADEVGLGSLCGPVYSAAVYWPSDLTHPLVKDSKTLNRRQKLIAYDFIKEEAIGYGIAKIDADEVDQINNKQAAIKAMHQAITNSHITPENIIVDGNYFKFYLDKTGEPVSHTCIVDGDAKYYSIAAASILGKVSHDLEIQKLCDDYPDLEKYGLRSNMGYGSAQHCKAIEEFGVTQFHRKTFSRVKEWLHKPNILIKKC